MTTKIERDFLTPHEVAELENVHVATVRRWIKIGALPAFRSPGGRQHRIPHDYRDRLGDGADSSARPVQSAARA